jgi:hypothetical protein
LLDRAPAPHESTCLARAPSRTRSSGARCPLLPMPHTFTPACRPPALTTLLEFAP